MKKVILFVVLYAILCASNCFAGYITGTVSSVVIRASDGLVYITVTGTRIYPAPCSTVGYWMIKDENSNVGKQQLAALLAANASKSEVTIYGTNTCTRWGDGEDIDSVIVK